MSPERSQSIYAANGHLVGMEKNGEMFSRNHLSLHRSHEEERMDKAYGDTAAVIASSFIIIRP